jgi:hypothetical protein
VLPDKVNCVCHIKAAMLAEMGLEVHFSRKVDLK